MPHTRQLAPKCFVAMAFDHDDTDRLYERSIRPVLRRNGITPIIVNRRESNDDLNQQIVTSLNTCDFCIADLTYTRPSVYFEAGYAQRAVPVIYTVRADHLHRGQPDDLRVHFDLQMKPLIRWSRSTDSQFMLRLERRIRATFLRHWTRSREADAKRDAQRRAFGAMPVAKRLSELRRQGMLACRPLGFRRWEPYLGQGNYTIDELLRSSQMLFAMAAREHEFRIVALLALDSFTTSFMRRLSWHVSFLRMMMPSSDTSSLSVRVHLLCLALRALPGSRIESVFADYSATQLPSRIERTSTASVGIGDAKRSVPLATLIDFISPITSPEEARKELRRRLTSAFGATA